LTLAGFAVRFFFSNINTGILDMRILVLTLMMSFLSHSALGAAEVITEGEATFASREEAESLFEWCTKPLRSMKDFLNYYKAAPREVKEDLSESIGPEMVLALSQSFGGSDTEGFELIPGAEVVAAEIEVDEGPRKMEKIQEKLGRMMEASQIDEEQILACARESQAKTLEINTAQGVLLYLQTTGKGHLDVNPHTAATIGLLLDMNKIQAGGRGCIFKTRLYGLLQNPSDEPTSMQIFRGDLHIASKVFTEQCPELFSLLPMSLQE
jgi:hypothetical protein